jgi:hypothetical protein
LLDHHGLADKFVRKVYREAEDPRDKYMRLMPEISNEDKSILIFENDANDIESAISCGIGADRIINVQEEG